jgi:hypothetical protein
MEFIVATKHIAQAGHHFKFLQTENTKYETAYKRCMDDPSVSYLFKEVLEKYDSHDPVNALNDAEMLVAAMRLKLGCPAPGHRKNF